MAAGVSQTRRCRCGSAEVQRWVFAQCKQVPWQELVPSGILAGGWAREMVLMSAFVPQQTEFCRPGAQQLSLPLSSSLPAFRAELLTYDLPDAKSACRRNTLSPAPPLLQARLGGSACPAGCPSTLAPSRQLWSAHCLSALPTLFLGPLVCVWFQRLRSASRLVVFWVI